MKNEVFPCHIVLNFVNGTRIIFRNVNEPNSFENFWCLFSARISRIKHLSGAETKAPHIREVKGVKSGGSNWENSPRDNNERFEWIAHESWQHIFHRHLSTFSRHFRIKSKVSSFLKIYKSKHRHCRLNTILVHFFKLFSPLSPDEKLTENIVNFFDFSKSFSASVWHLALASFSHCWHFSFFSSLSAFYRCWNVRNFQRCHIIKLRKSDEKFKSRAILSLSLTFSSLFMCDERGAE